MTYQSGWALVRIETGEQINSWIGINYGETAAMPNPVRLPNGDDVHCPSEETNYGGYKIVKVFSEDEPPDPGLTRPRLIAAAFNVAIANGDIQSIEGAFNLIGALYLDVGQYMLLFLTPEDNADYVAQVIDGGMNIKVTEKDTSYMMVEARDGNDVLADATQFGIQVYRF